MKLTSSHLSLRRPEAGSALLAALAILAVVLVATAAALFEASHRYRTSNQSSRWAQAEQAAEAGAEIALLSAQTGSWVTDGWSGVPGAPGAVPVTKAIALDTGVPATGPINSTVSVDKITMGTKQWLRIRSRGIADLAGASREGIDNRDVTLRKLTLQTDRVTGTTVNTPQAIRMVEILAQPAGSPYQRALLLDKKFNMSGGGVIDSFDSSDPAKSTSGLYDISKRQSKARVGVNDTQGASDLKSTFVYGDVAYNGPPIQNTDNVQGTITDSFSNPVSPVEAPVWSSYNPTPSIINSTSTLTGGPKSSPALYKVTSVNVPGGKVLTLAPHAAGQESYLEVWVTGDFTTSGSGYILQQPGVHVTYHIAGDITVSGSSFNNQSNLAANNIINVISPPVGTTQKVTVSGGGTFIGAINAPGADFTLSGSANFSGAMVGKTINISGGASLHYDEALVKNTGGTAAYKVASWVEGVR